MKGWLVAVIFPFHTGKPQNDALPDSAAVRDMNAFRRSHFRFAQVDFQSPLKQLPRLTVSLKPDAQDRMYDRGKRGIMGSIRIIEVIALPDLLRGKPLRKQIGQHEYVRLLQRLDPVIILLRHLSAKRLGAVRPHRFKIRLLIILKMVALGNDPDQSTEFIRP